MNEVAIKARIELLKTRPANNENIIRKLERKLRALHNAK
jgi:uncharacterized protein YlaN (UPF0358 family)